MALAPEHHSGGHDAGHRFRRTLVVRLVDGSVASRRMGPDGTLTAAGTATGTAIGSAGLVAD